jgi:bifunctional non-homologous end joining protein LigD
MSLRERARPGLGIIEPCLPSPAERPPAGPNWLHEIKHDGFRIMARRDGAGVRLFTRHGHDFTARFPLAAEALAALPAHSFLIDGEAIVTDAKGLAVFDLIRRARNGGATVLCAFDLIELDGADLRRARLSTASRNWRGSFAARVPALYSTSTTTATATSCSSMPASSAARASYRNGLARLIAPGVRHIG